jgi:hypothetical protein
MLLNLTINSFAPAGFWPKIDFLNKKSWTNYSLVFLHNIKKNIELKYLDPEKKLRKEKKL